mmetsp:Transcript_42622/g.110149  ORF Transcript_42622/g.110149 Transcript_42622/m.110149 type:complete len:322 (+) Transcript_42622:859-1824(+)
MGQEVWDQPDGEREHADQVDGRREVGPGSGSQHLKLRDRCPHVKWPPEPFFVLPHANARVGLVFHTRLRLLVAGVAQGPQLGRLVMVGIGQVDRLQAHQVGANEEVDLAGHVAPGRHRVLQLPEPLRVAPQEGADHEEERAPEERDGNPVRKGAAPLPHCDRRIPEAKASAVDALGTELTTGSHGPALTPAEVAFPEGDVLPRETHVPDPIHQVRQPSHLLCGLARHSPMSLDALRDHIGVDQGAVRGGRAMPRGLRYVILRDPWPWPRHGGNITSGAGRHAARAQLLVVGRHASSQRRRARHLALRCEARGLLRVFFRLA